ncbi:MAG: ATP-binding protein [Candidatus Beckwithbacteria bacterium]|nr:ATP-binding protein [Patescibacteria group bacterium]
MSIIRNLTRQAKKHLDKDQVTIIIGCRQSGKTTILHQLEKIIIRKNHPNYFINLEDPDYLRLLKLSPKNLFKIFPINTNYKNYIFIDEIQYLDNPTNFLKYFYDEYKGKIKLIVSGSSAFYLDQKFKDSLVGRKKIFQLNTLSFKEFLNFKNKPELSKLDFNQLKLNQLEKIQQYYSEYIVYGGYPRVVLADLENKKEVLEDIAYSYIKKDVFEAKIRQEEVFYRLIKILASQTGQLINSSELANTLNVSKTSIDNYIHLMQKSFHLKLIKPFYRNLRKEITKMPKAYFYDLGLKNLLTNNLTTWENHSNQGSLLENACFRQLIEIYPEDDIKFWRTASKQEVDFVVNNQAYEVKTSPSNFRKTKYKSFQNQYPQINLKIITLDTNKTQVKGTKIIKVWQL